MKTSSYVNLGCGRRYHPEWINIDFQSYSPDVIKHDLRKGIPLSDRTCEAVYHSAVIEHFDRPTALSFLRDCYRVLKPGGVVRVGTPDLEQQCRIYLEKLAACRNNKDVEADYDWIMLEMYDQFAREKSGGAMVEFLRDAPAEKLDFVFSRIGEEGRQIVHGARKMHAVAPEDPLTVRQRFWHWRRNKRDWFAALFLGDDAMQAMKVGLFRMSGETHKWAYDDMSLSRLLLQAGFVEPVRQAADSSCVPDWNRFNLDTLEDGTHVKPDIFFMEAVRPIQDRAELPTNSVNRCE